MDDPAAQCFGHRHVVRLFGISNAFRKTENGLGAIQPSPFIIFVSCLYLGLLFAIAYWADRRADSGRSVISHPTVYALSLAVYCSAWTYYGSVGRAAASGIGFLPIYLGPTLAAALWGYLLLKMIRVSKSQRITSIADFIASRYGKSHLLGGLVTVIAVVGVGSTLGQLQSAYGPPQASESDCVLMVWFDTRPGLSFHM